jgi:arylsulfatase A-like enzyme
MIQKIKSGLSRCLLPGFFAAQCSSALSITLAEAENPNVIFILTDDMGSGDFGAAGHPYVKTPNIDRLAREGTVFNGFYVNSAVCGPSRAAFMTGRFPARLNAHHIYKDHDFNVEHGVPDFLDPELLTVADVMKKAGYTTGHIGKWHLCGKSGPAPEEYGFDHALVSHDGNASPLYKERWKTTPYQVTASSHWIVQDGIDFIKKSRDSGRPFYLNLWTLVPHARLNPSPEELAVYDDLHADLNDFSAWMKDYASQADDLTSQMKVYCASMTSLDTAIGKLLEYLDESGLAENTLIVFSSDNGPEDYHAGSAANAGVGSPGELRGRKRSAYLGGMRVPMIVRWPGHVAPGKVSDAVWSAVDLLPTLAKVVGVPSPQGLDGENVTPVLFGAGQGRQAPLFWEWKFEIFGNQDYRPPQLAMLDGKWWAGCNPDRSRPELYEIGEDPSQTNNVAAAHPELMRRFMEQLLDWKKTIPESFYSSEAVQTNGRVIPLLRRVGFEPESGTVKADEASGGTGVFGAAKTGMREVYLWFDASGLSQQPVQDLKLNLIVRSQSGAKDSSQAADDLVIDYMGGVDSVEYGVAQVSSYSSAPPEASFKSPYRGPLLTTSRFPESAEPGHHVIPLHGIHVAHRKYILFRLRDASPQSLCWSECSMKTFLSENNVTVH